METNKFEVFVDDNFHYQDKDERYQLGTFNTLQEAIAQCQALVDEFLNEAFTDNSNPITSAEDLYRRYTTFGPDPFIVGNTSELGFRAWDYARVRCEEIVGA